MKSMRCSDASPNRLGGSSAMRSRHEWEQRIVWYTERRMSSPEEIRPARMWRQMPSELKVSAARAFWADEQAALEQAEAVALIARQIKFRPKSVISLAVDKKARHLAGLAQ